MNKHQILSKNHLKRSFASVHVRLENYVAVTNSKHFCHALNGFNMNLLVSLTTVKHEGRNSF